MKYTTQGSKLPQYINSEISNLRRSGSEGEIFLRKLEGFRAKDICCPFISQLPGESKADSADILLLLEVSLLCLDMFSMRRYQGLKVNATKWKVLYLFF